MNDLDLQQEVSAFLAVCRTATLATVAPDGAPHAACVQFVADAKWRLAWVSAEGSAHSRHLVEHPRCAVTVYAHDDRPERIHGLQLRGMAAILDGDQRAAALDLYRVKYPFVADEPYASAIDRQGVYRFTPTWLRWLDNRRGFGFKVEQTPR
ncbi:MAG: pyridoxamine 5'-phosphate oxidase family protein [Planctomycetota bacterium]